MATSPISGARVTTRSGGDKIATPFGERAGVPSGGPDLNSPEPTENGLAAASGPPARLQRWLREPLLHFLLAGFALFVAYGVLNPELAERDASNQIKLTEDDLRQMTIAWLAQGRSPPTPEQMRSLVEVKVREEILFREALALGLDRNDTIVKRRLAQKMEFLAEDLSGIGDPAPDELKVWFENNAERFAFAPRASFRHLYFSPDHRGTRARDDAAQLLGTLGSKPANWPIAAGFADPFMFQDYYGDRTLDQVASDFGAKFAQSLFELESSSWQGPIESGYGWHLVWIDSMALKRVPAFEEVEPEVKREWIAERRAETKRRAYEAMRARYEIVLPGSLTEDIK